MHIVNLQAYKIFAAFAFVIIAGLWFTFQANTIIEFAVLMLLGASVMFMAYMLIVNRIAQKLAQLNYSKTGMLFNLATIYAILYTFAMAVVFCMWFSYRMRQPMQVPDDGETPIITVLLVDMMFIGLDFFLFNLLLLPLHLLFVAAFGYVLYKTASSLSAACTKADHEISTVLLLFAFALYPIGVWVIQPRLNALFSKQQAA